MSHCYVCPPELCQTEENTHTSKFTGANTQRPLNLIPSMVVCPSLMFRGQGRDVHPQLLVSQRQTQELRLDNQLQTSMSFSVISGLTFFKRQVHRLVVGQLM
ncbi:hypothetical protein AMECASPLE_001151 [Ameca splendens]|uniref:Uncharacterized protein n=1 Tax=Ameca splendens TaxID=208324 RepID=A0ABV0XXW9_9TELE